MRKGVFTSLIYLLWTIDATAFQQCKQQTYTYRQLYRKLLRLLESHRMLLRLLPV
jgi:hypothetical protein